jgi:hypothetical protein
MASRGDPDGRLYTVQAQPGSGSSGFGEMWLNDPNGKFHWEAPNGFSVLAYKCEVTNFSSHPLVSIVLPLVLNFIDAVPNGSGGVASLGDGIVQESSIPIPKLEPGSQNRFTFYILSMTDKFVRISFNNFGTASKVDDDTKLRVRISQQDRGPVSMYLSPSPLFSSSPPALPGPAPGPPANAPQIHGGNVDVGGTISAGNGSMTPGGDAVIQGGAGNGVSGGNVTLGPGHYSAGDGGQSGRGGDLIIKGGDAK